MSNGNHYISTGDKNCFYTLRYRFSDTGAVRHEDGTVETYEIVRDFHIRNLSIDKAEAIAKAKEITGKDLSADFEVGQISRVDQIDWSIFQGGKYTGRSIHEVAETDRDYLIYICENCATSRNYAKTVELAKALIQHELDQRAGDRQQAHAEAEARKEQIKAKLGKYADILHDGRRGFCDSIAEGIRRGELPTGRGADITLDILAKRCGGRARSKAYNAAYEEIGKQFNEFDENIWFPTK